MLDLIIGIVNKIRSIFNRGPIFKVICIISYEKRDITREFLLSKMWCLGNEDRTFIIIYKEKGIKYRMICNRREITNIFPYKWHEMKMEDEDETLILLNCFPLHILGFYMYLNHYLFHL